MTDLHTAAKQALEALELEEAQTHYPPQWLLKAIAALRQALANSALDKMAENARELGLDYELQDKDPDLIEQPAQQEPVAWMHTMIDDVVIGHRPADIARHPDRWTPLYTAPSPCPTCEALARTVMMDQTAHDTPPAQRTWVGLTDGDIYKMTILMGFNPEWKPEVEMVYSIVRNLETKLKEKNT